MTIRKRFGSPIAGGLAILMMLPLADLQAAQAQQATATQQDKSDQASPPNQPTAADPSTNGGAASQNPPDAPTRSSIPAGDSTTSSDSQNNGETKPLGTAAAPYTKTTGVMGSRPAGAVIAPAKQRRVHAILISVAVIAAAGIAIGTVAGLSKGSPSRP